VNVSLELPKQERLILLITDINGRALLQREMIAEQGSSIISFPVNRLTSGMYLLKLIYADGCIVEKFVKQ